MKIESGTNSPMNMVVGVTSFGINCGQKNRPGIYTKVFPFIQWIENIVWNNNVTNVNDTTSKNVTLISDGRVTV